MKNAVPRAGEVLRQLLETIPIIQVESIEAQATSGDWEPDLMARLIVDGRKHVIVCAYKPSGQPRYFRSTLLELRNYLAHMR